VNRIISLTLTPAEAAGLHSLLVMSGCEWRGTATGRLCEDLRGRLSVAIADAELAVATAETSSAPTVLDH
jgi:hypothetical protein